MNGHEHLLWSETGRRELLDAHIFTIYSTKRRSADGADAEFVLVDSPDWATVVAPYTREDGTPCFVMARQFRQGSRSVTIEFPGGLVDPDEAPEDAALRELEEETGYRADSLTLIGRTNPNPAFMSNTSHAYLAHGVRPAEGQNLDENERLDAELVPVDSIVRLVRPDFHVHAIMLAALHWYTLYERDGLGYEDRLGLWKEASR